MKYYCSPIKPNGEVCVSALDHIYYSSELERNLSTKTLNNSSTDHLPVKCEIRSIPKNLSYSRKITKRSLKNFTDEAWNVSLENKNWSDLENCKTVDEMVDIFTENINLALDEVTPFKTFTVKSNYKFGLSNETKILMKRRDATRDKIGLKNL